MNRRGVVALFFVALAGAAAADPYPNRPIRMVAGFPAGGTIDALSRTIAAQVESQLGRTIVVDNRSGANGMIAADIVARALPDGYTLLFSPPALIINQIIAKPSYDVLRDLIPVANTALGEGSLIVVHPSLPGEDRAGADRAREDKSRSPTARRGSATRSTS